jgi:hypothetical protein
VIVVVVAAIANVHGVRLHPGEREPRVEHDRYAIRPVGCGHSLPVLNAMSRWHPPHRRTKGWSVGVSACQWRVQECAPQSRIGRRLTIARHSGRVIKTARPTSGDVAMSTLPASSSRMYCGDRVAAPSS